MSKTFQHIEKRIELLNIAMKLASDQMYSFKSEAEWQEAVNISRKSFAEYMVLSNLQRVMLKHGEN